MKKTKFLSALLAAAMVFSTFTATALADEETAEAAIGEVKYSTLANAFADAKKGDTVKLLKDITVSTQIDIIDREVLQDITLDGDNHTIKAETSTNPQESGKKSVLYFGKSDGEQKDKTYCYGVKIKDLTISGTARFAIFLHGGTTSTFDNVNINGDYFYTINMYGTHGVTFNNCNISNSSTFNASGNKASALWSSVAVENPVILNNTTISSVNINCWKKPDNIASFNKAKLIINDGSKIGTLYAMYDKTVYDENDLYLKNIYQTSGTGKIENVLYCGFETDPITKETNTEYTVWHEAKVGDIEYATLADAIEAAGDNATVTLINDVVTDAITIPADKDITIDLAGYDLEFTQKEYDVKPKKYNLINNGILTINDKTGKSKIFRRDCEDNVGWYLIDNQGTLTINGGNYIYGTGKDNDWAGNSLIRNAGQGKAATLTINGGTFTQDLFIVIKNDDEGVLNINGGVFNSKGINSINKNVYVVENWGNATIKGGTFNGPISGFTWSDKYQSNLVIDYAEVNGRVDISKAPKYENINNVPTATINGGVYTTDVSKWIGKGKGVFKSGDKYKVLNVETQTPTVKTADSAKVKASLESKGTTLNDNTTLRADYFEQSFSGSVAVRATYTFAKGDKSTTSSVDFDTSKFEGTNINATFGIILFNIPTDVTVSEPTISILK